MRNDVKCPECEAAEQASEVRTLGPEKSVKIPGAQDDKFWDEDGNYHDHRAIEKWEQRCKCNQTPPHIFTIERAGEICHCGYPVSGPYVES